jgi:thymidylate synthase
MEGLKQYAEQLMDPAKIGFDYTYGNRLRARESVFDDPDTCVSVMEWDQINLIIGKLKRAPTSRRGVAITWYPERDILADHAPCLQLLDFLIRDGHLNATAFFRSWDVGRAAVPNMYGIAKLMEHITKEVGFGFPVGSLTIVAVSAHVYSE